MKSIKKRSVHPGEISEGFSDAARVERQSARYAIGVSANRITELVAEKRSITAETALLLVRRSTRRPSSG